MEPCNIFTKSGCAIDSEACSNTKWDMFKSISVSLAKIITMIALPGSNLIIQATELVFAVLDLAKAAYKFFITRL